jgi:8-oxo-dGTP pyrophosphatase MutT (NUDIX family)
VARGVPEVEKAESAARIEPLREYLRRNPEYAPAWRYRGWELSNPDFARFEQVVVLRDGRPLWDQVAIRERAGAVAVPYLLEPLRMGLVEVPRPVAGLRTSLEFPRGFGRPGEPGDEAALRELAEEAGWGARALSRIGRINPNTAFYATEIDVWAVLADPASAGAPGGGKEARRAFFVPFASFWKMAERGCIRCGVTLAAAALFAAWCLRTFLLGRERIVLGGVPEFSPEELAPAR